MSSSSFRDETASKRHSAKGYVNGKSSTTCSFCCFVLTMYPTLKGMTDLDGAMFREHLKRAHALCDEIRA